MTDLLIYGATGFTGSLTARRAAELGLRPVLGGRNPDKLAALAEPLGLEWRAAALDAPDELDAALAGVNAVVHMAGPFSTTSGPMLEACLRTGTHYLDITGEIDVFEACAAADARARDAGITVMPGVGFDVVPSDCLALHVAGRLPGATRLEMAIAALGRRSRGTTKTSLESIARPMRVRRNGVIVALDTPLYRDVDYGRGPRRSVAVAWGDVATAFHTTGIPDVTVYFPAAGAVERLVRMPPPLRRALASRPARRVLSRLVELGPAGPDEAYMARSRATVVAIASTRDGKEAAARLSTPDGYALTAETALAAATRAAAGATDPGFRTPASQFGADFILEFAGCDRVDLDN